MKLSERIRFGKMKYRTHKCHAKKRGIDFLFTFEEWFDWWESKLGPDWVTKRGCRKGQFCMARIKDKGPYVVWNVKCILHQDNCREQKTNGTCARGVERGSKLQPEQVLKIFNHRGSYSKIGKAFGVSTETVYDIKRKRSWKHLTIGLSPPVTLSAP